MTRRTSVVLGYHGCDQSVAHRALNEGIDLTPSNQDYDWLGPGVYFWENDPVRALEWAQAKVRAGRYSNASVIGAAIDLGNCLDLTLRENVELLLPAYESLKALDKTAGTTMPKNQDIRSKNRGDKLLRFRDCAVIRHLHRLVDAAALNPSGYPAHVVPFDSVRGLFVEGKPAYPGSGFYAQSHAQIAVINAKCILGVFKPR